MRLLIGALVAAIVVTGCTKSPDNRTGSEPSETGTAQQQKETGTAADHTQTGTPSEAGGARLPVPEAARMEGDHQVVTVTVTDMGYSPASIELKAGVPAKVVFKQTTDSQCLSQIKINDFGIAATDLPLNQETTIEFTPGQTGTYSFTCGMDMARGTIIVAS
jgi:plastocyanin